MPQENSGLKYYLNLIDYDISSYRIHYLFSENSGSIVPNGATGYPQYTGSLSSTGRFWTQASGSGYFTGQRITVNRPSGLGNDFWTHLFIYEKTGSGKGVIIDTSKTGANNLRSGYQIGLNSNNRIYLETFTSEGQISFTSSLVLGNKNLVAVVKANNNLTFYNYDYNNQEILSDNFPIFGNYTLNSDKLVLGNPNSEFSFSETAPYSGFIDEYIYLTDALSPFSLRYFASGLASVYNFVSGTVSGYSGIQVTGYASGFTGVTGVTGFGNLITGSGIDPFGTGEYELFYGTTGLTGFLTSGRFVNPLTGYVTFYITGDSRDNISLNSGYLSGFYYDQVTYLRNIDIDDLSSLYAMQNLGGGYNKQAGFDAVEGKFQLDSLYAEDSVEVYLNGISQIATGYLVTGNIYNSGINISGDYFIEGFYLNSTGFFDQNDVLIYDSMSGARRRNIVTSLHSGVQISGTGLVYFNGVLLTSGYEYTGNNIITNRFSGVSGAITVFPLNRNQFRTGEFFPSGLRIFRNNSLLFLNGQRQLIISDNLANNPGDYIENSSYDLLGNSGIFNNNLDMVFNKDTRFFEN